MIFKASAIVFTIGFQAGSSATGHAAAGAYE
jgi:hypothetical protein